MEALRPGMRREVMVVEDEYQYGQVIVSLAAMEVRFSARCGSATAVQFVPASWVCEVARQPQAT